MKKRCVLLTFISVFTLLLVGTGGVLTVHAAQNSPIQVLYVSGGGYHDYESQKEIVTQGLSERLDIEWTIEFDTSLDIDQKIDRFTKPDWHQDFDAVIYNLCFANVNDTEYIENITNAHYKDGVAAIFMHCAMHTFRDAETEEWDRLIGLRTYTHERGEREIRIEVANPGHPLLMDFPGTYWISPQDELYMILETFDSLIPLTHAYGPETDRMNKVMWANTYGNARVVGIAAGHHNEVIAEPIYLDFLANGLTWTLNNVN